MQKDPKFAEFVDKVIYCNFNPIIIEIIVLCTYSLLQVVSEMKLEDEFRKPDWTDLLIAKLAMFPYVLYKYMTKSKTASIDKLN